MGGCDYIVTVLIAGVDLIINVRKGNKSDRDMQKLLDTVVDEFQEDINLSDLLLRLLDDDLQVANPERRRIELYVESPQRSKTQLMTENVRKLH